MAKWCKKGGARGYVTTRQITWRAGGKHAPSTFIIPTGFEFESSVPTLKIFGQKLPPWAQPLYWIVSPDDPRFLLAACIHDFFLERAAYEVLAAAAEWHAAAKKSKAPAIMRVPMFVCVALFTLKSKTYTQA